MARSTRLARSPRPVRSGRLDRLRPSPTSRNHRADFGLGDHLARAFGLAAEPPHVLLPGDLTDVIFDSVARHHRLAEFRLVDGEEIDLLGLVTTHLRQHAD